MLSPAVDRLLAPYLKEAGLTKKAESYGNWKNTGLDGPIYLEEILGGKASWEQIKTRVKFVAQPNSEVASINEVRLMR